MKLRTLGDTGVKLYTKQRPSAKFVCFKCRLCIHKADHYYPSKHSNAGKCTNCQGPLHYAGSAFRAPKRQNKKEWAKLEVLIRDGVRFHYHGGNGKLPDTARDAVKVRALRRKKPIFARLTANGKRVLVKTNIDHRSLFASIDNGEIIYCHMNYGDRYHVAQ